VRKFDKERCQDHHVESVQNRVCVWPVGAWHALVRRVRRALFPFKRPLLCKGCRLRWHADRQRGQKWIDPQVCGRMRSAKLQWLTYCATRKTAKRVAGSSILRQAIGAECPSLSTPHLVTPFLRNTAGLSLPPYEKACL